MSCSRRPPFSARDLLARLVLGTALLGTVSCSSEGGHSQTTKTGGASSNPDSNESPSSPTRDPSTTESESPPSGGSASIDEGIAFGSASSTPQREPCSVSDEAREVFSEQKVLFGTSVGRVFYSWTTPAQEAKLRADGPLFAVGEMPGLGRGRAMDKFYAHADSVEGASVERELTERFSEFRYAWPNPWATRMGTKGEDYGDRLVRIELRAEAWIGRIDATTGALGEVVDLFGELVSREEVEAAPHRIGALYYEHKNAETDSPSCYFGTFSSFEGSGGYREFIVGNLEMVESWSMGTEDIFARLEQDIELLKKYLALVRPCALVGTNFNAVVTCNWGQLEDSYFEALALPSELYEPTAQRLVALIERLEGDSFEIDPLERRPSPVPR